MLDASNSYHWRFRREDLTADAAKDVLNYLYPKIYKIFERHKRPGARHGVLIYQKLPISRQYDIVSVPNSGENNQLHAGSHQELSTDFSSAPVLITLVCMP